MNEKILITKQLVKNYKLFTQLKTELIKICKIENIGEAGIHLAIYKNSDKTYDLCILLQEEKKENDSK